MEALACVVLVFCGLILMVSQGVGPFAKDPWEKHYFAYRKLSKLKQYLLLVPAVVLAIICSLIIIGVIQF